MILSPYTNHILREHLHFKEYAFFTKKIIQLLGVSKNTEKFKDIAPWVGQLIKGLENHPEIELYSVAPHIKLQNRTEEFRYGNTSYIFYSSEYSSALRLIGNYSVWKKMQNCGKLVCEIAERIHPDVVISYGTENPVNSYPAICLKDKYPVLTVLQTIYNNPDRILYSNPNRLIQDLEKDIIANIDYFGSTFNFYCRLLRGMKANARILKFSYLSASFPQVNPVEKKYDFVNYAFNLDLRKGDEDSIRALSIVKKKYPNVTLNLAGGLSRERKEYLNNLINDLGLSANVTFTGMFEKKEDMYQHIMQSRFAVLPVKMDLISTTMKECMYYKIPVVTNITPETPSLNIEKQRLLLAEKDNIESLANCMLKLMEDSNLADLLSYNGYEYMQAELDNDIKIKSIIDSLYSMYDHFYKKKPIDSVLLMN